MAKRLNQLVAQEKDLKKSVENIISKEHHATEKKELTMGFTKTFSPKDEESDFDIPPETKVVQVRVKESLETATKELKKLLDFEATKDSTNTGARADVVVDGEVLLKDVPATTLIFLEKQLGLHRTFIQKMAELPEDETWFLDPNSGLYKSPEIKTVRTAKLPKPIVLYPHSENHPAQTQMVTEDKIVGHYNTQKMSGAIPRSEKQELLERVEKLIVAVKEAREEANMAEVKELKVGEAISKFLGI